MSLGTGRLDHEFNHNVKICPRQLKNIEKKNTGPGRVRTRHPRDEINETLYVTTRLGGQIIYNAKKGVAKVKICSSLELFLGLPNIRSVL